MERFVRDLRLVLQDFIRDIDVRTPREDDRRKSVRDNHAIIRHQVARTTHAAHHASRGPLVRDRLRWASTKHESFVRSVLRSQFVQAWRNTEVWALLLQAEEACSHGVVLLGPHGRVEYASTRARTLIGQYLPSQRRWHGGHLPAQLARWVRKQDGLLPAAHRALSLPAPLRVKRDNRNLIVHFFPGVAQRLLLLEERVTSTALRAIGFLGLTPREAEVLNWLTQGKTNGEIATILGLSRRTAEKHVEHILRKLGVENRTAASRALAEAPS